jgi:hypothetical protein
VGKNISNDEKAIHNCYIHCLFVKIERTILAQAIMMKVLILMGDFISEQEKQFG